MLDDESYVYDASLKLIPRPDGVLATGMAWTTYRNKLVIDSEEDEIIKGTLNWLPVY